MKSLIIIALSFCFSLFTTATLKAGTVAGNEQLVKEITEIVKKQYPKFIAVDPQDVTIHFQINAKNELVIFDTTGENEETCEKVKEVLNFKQIKFDKAVPLKQYVVQIRFNK